MRGGKGGDIAVGAAIGNATGVTGTGMTRGGTRGHDGRMRGGGVAALIAKGGDTVTAIEMRILLGDTDETEIAAAAATAVETGSGRGETTRGGAGAGVASTTGNDHESISKARKRGISEKVFSDDRHEQQLMVQMLARFYRKQDEARFNIPRPRAPTQRHPIPSF